MLKKLRIKFVCINMSLITVMLVFILSMVLHITQAGLEQRGIEHLNEIASKPLYFLRPDRVPAGIPPFFSLRLNGNGDLIDSYSTYYDLSDSEYIKTLIEDSLKTREKTGTLAGQKLRFLRISTPSEELFIFTDISGELSTMENLTRTCIIIGIVSFFGFLLISIFLANWAVRPVERAWHQQKQFVADASHELKTPLTVILTNAELITIPDINKEDQRKLSENILTMSKQMKGLVEGLLDLSRADGNTLNLSMESFDFSRLTAQTLSQFEPLYYERQLMCRPKIEPELFVKGSPSHLKQVLEILFDNGLKYADPDSFIEIDLKQQGKHLLFSITTKGDPLSKEDLSNIFKRFYRVEKSRNSSGSYGLGLSIAKSIVTEHKGNIWAESSGEKNTFFVRLPAAEHQGI